MKPSRPWSVRAAICRPRGAASSFCLLLFAAAACTGIFQRPLPSVADSFARVDVGAQLLVGAAQADITPSQAQYMAGFNLGRVSTGVHSWLEVRALVFVVGQTRVAIVGIDSLGIERQDVEWIKSGIYGFQNGCVFLCSSHTHAAPDLIGLWGFYYLSSGRDRRYLTRVRAAVADAVARAAKRVRPARLVRGEARLPARGLVHNTNRRGLFDRRITVLFARDAESGEPIGAILHLGCHPEIMRRRETLISADFVGDLCDRWRAARLGQAVFVNGALGAMVTPNPRHAKGVAEMGRRLFELAKGSLETAQPVEGNEIEVRRRDVYLGITSPGLLLGRLTTVLPRNSFGGLLRSSVGYLRIGDFEAACVPGEIEPALAESIRQATGRPQLAVFALVDDELGYLMREVDAHDRLFAYERLMSPAVTTGKRVADVLTGQ